MTFSLHQRGVVMSSPITLAQSLTMHSLAHILGSYAFISVVAPFPQFIPTPSCNGIPPLSRCISPQGTAAKEPRNHAKWTRETQSSTYALGLSTPYYLSRTVSQSAQSLFCVPKATFTPSIQCNLGLTLTNSSFSQVITYITFDYFMRDICFLNRKSMHFIF